MIRKLDINKLFKHDAYFKLICKYDIYKYVNIILKLDIKKLFKHEAYFKLICK